MFPPYGCGAPFILVVSSCFISFVVIVDFMFPPYGGGAPFLLVVSSCFISFVPGLRGWVCSLSQGFVVYFMLNL